MSLDSLPHVRLRRHLRKRFASTDKFIQAKKHTFRNCDSQCSGRFEVNDDLEFTWLLNREIIGLRTPKYLVDIVGCASRHWCKSQMKKCSIPLAPAFGSSPLSRL